MSGLSPRARDRLLRLARAAIRHGLAGGNAVQGVLDEGALASELRGPRGVFVSLKTRAADGPRLRGCVGRVEATLPLYRAVIDLAPRAALEDSRFPPLTLAELPRTSIELSVLGEPHPVSGAGEIEVGRDGVRLRRGPAHAVFLPQVGAERGWDTRELLEQLARKAGLDADAWRGSELSVFGAEVFGEQRSETVSDGEAGGT